MLCDLKTIIITITSCCRFETREGVAARLEEEGAEPEIVARVKRGGMK